MTTSNPSSDAEVSDLFNRMCAAWTAGDATAYGACFTEDSDYVSYDSSHAQGRAAMVESHDQLFKGVLTGSALVGSVESIRYLRPDVAVMHATGSVLMPWRSTLPKRRLSRQTIVAVHSEDGWKVAALHNGRVRAVKVPKSRLDALPRIENHDPRRQNAAPRQTALSEGTSCVGLRLTGWPGASEIRGCARHSNPAAGSPNEHE